MRIGVNCFLLQPQVGGIKQYFLTIFRELLENDTGNRYVFFWYRQNAEELATLGSDRWREHAVLLNEQTEVLAHLNRIDLYFCPLSALYPRPLARPTVVTLPDIQEVFYPEFFSVADLYTRDLHFPSSTRLADRVITHSEFSRSTIIRQHRIAPSKVIVAHHSVDKRFYESERVARRPNLSLPHDFILYPANLWRHKNHGRLLQAIHLLRVDRGLEVPLLLTGFLEPGDRTLADMAAEYGVHDLVQHLGYLRVEEVAYLYRAARMLVFPSLFEGFGMPLVEAMAAGCPVAAANATSIPEVAGDAAALFDPNSAASIAACIEQLWRDEARRRSLADKGRVRAACFTAARSASAHLLAFEQARRTYSYGRFLWQRHVYQHYHRLRVEMRWRKRLGGVH